MNPKLESQLRRIGNSVGLWVILFAGFGLVSLSLGEEKIQRRMFRNHMRMQYHLNAGENVSQTDQAGETDQAVVLADPEQPFTYRLTGLRWLLGGAMAVGLVLLVFEIRKPLPDIA